MDYNFFSQTIQLEDYLFLKLSRKLLKLAKWGHECLDLITLAGLL